MARGILSWYIGICAALVLLVQCLSAIHEILLWPLIVCVGILILGTLIIARPRLQRPHIAPVSPQSILNPLVLPFAVALPIIAVISFALGWHMPPNNWDAMTYHLSRAAYWRQWHTLAHFPTNNWRQNVFPGNAEILLLVTMLIAHSAQLAFLVQFTAYVAATLAVYGLGRHLGLRPTFSLVGAGAFATMPEVVLQSSSAQNDLTVAAFVVCAVYFLIDAVTYRRNASIVLAGAALGLAMGTEPTAILALPGLGLGATVILWSMRHRLRMTRRSAAGIALAALLALLLGAPWYLANEVDFGNVSGPPAVAQAQEVAHPSLSTFRVNFLRYLVAFIDPAGPAMLSPQAASLACGRATELRARLVVASGIPQVEPSVEWPGEGYNYAPTCGFNEDLTWFGLVGWLAVSIALIWTVLGLATRRLGSPWMLAVGATSFVVCASLLLRWSPWQGRLLITMVALSAPLLGFLTRELSSRRLGRPLLHLIVLYAVLTGLSTVTGNSSKPLGLWGATPADVQVATRPEMGPILKNVARTVPTNAHLGVFLNGDDWDFPLFGPHLDRPVEPLILSAGATRYVTPPSRLPYVLTHQPETDIVSLFHHLQLKSCHLAWVARTADAAVPWKLFDCMPRSSNEGL